MYLCVHKYENVCDICMCPTRHCCSDDENLKIEIGKYAFFEGNAFKMRWTFPLLNIYLPVKVIENLNSFWVS